jgi:hypothetical protein
MGGGIVINNPEVKYILIRNNIFYQSGQALRIDDSVPLSQLTIDHNLTNDPQFVNASTSNFRLRANSPAIDAGSPVEAPEYDFDDKFRPIGSGFDIGAFEYGSAFERAIIVLPLLLKQ